LQTLARTRPFYFAVERREQQQDAEANIKNDKKGEKFIQILIPTSQHATAPSS
jgi:hypothetical protein